MKILRTGKCETAVYSLVLLDDGRQVEFKSKAPLTPAELEKLAAGVGPVPEPDSPDRRYDELRTEVLALDEKDKDLDKKLKALKDKVK